MSEQLTAEPAGLPPLRLLIGATGSVDILHLPEYLRVLKTGLRCSITVLMTPAAAQFLSPDAISIFTDRVIHGERPGDWPTDKPSRIVADHDLLAVLPATANTLSAVASGSAANRLTTVILAATFPVIFFPVMGSAMWERAAVRRNVRQIRADGYFVSDPKWHENYDFALRKAVAHPSLPPPEDVAAILGQLWRGEATAETDAEGRG